MLLAINTATSQFSCAVLDLDGTILAEYLISRQKGHFGSFMPTLDCLLSNLNTDIHDQKAVVVTNGPGSFTGLRVGLSAAKGLCQGLGIPIIGVPTLEALASQVHYSDLPITPVLHSRKNELFAAQYMGNENRDLDQIMDITALRIEDLPAMFGKPSMFIGNDFKKQGVVLKNALGPLARLAPPDQWQIKASALGVLGLRRFHAQDFDDPQTLDPIYLRPPDIRSNPFSLRKHAKGRNESD